ncbi:hypothetical protein PIB30_012646 [Stylosanthes scabra]|uniref:RNase H type-1 domain-containing protein n=1 Tax=Stylosanthes scabra TaxID=79078 RepID=A0ABU6Z3P7_9FABA|nr:hypothetical protein [Stylosanthes scabra]
MAWDLGMRRVIVGSDSLEAVKELITEDHPHSFNALVRDIRSFKNRPWEVRSDPIRTEVGSDRIRSIVLEDRIADLSQTFARPTPDTTHHLHQPPPSPTKPPPPINTIHRLHSPRVHTSTDHDSTNSETAKPPQTVKHEHRLVRRIVGAASSYPLITTPRRLVCQQIDAASSFPVVAASFCSSPTVIPTAAPRPFQLPPSCDRQ